MMCECTRARRIARGYGCRACEDLDTRRRKLERDSIALKVSRLLCWHYPDWLDGSEIRDAIDDDETAAALWKLRQAGKVEQRKEDGAQYMYRLRRAA